MNLHSQFLFSPRNPHLKGSEYHTICYGESDIIYGWGGLEVRNNNITGGRPEFKTIHTVKTVGLMF